MRWLLLPVFFFEWEPLIWVGATFYSFGKIKGQFFCIETNPYDQKSVSQCFDADASNQMQTLQRRLLAYCYLQILQPHIVSFDLIKIYSLCVCVTHKSFDYKKNCERTVCACFYSSFTSSNICTNEFHCSVVINVKNATKNARAIVEKCKKSEIFVRAPSKWAQVNVCATHTYRVHISMESKIKWNTLFV